MTFIPVWELDLTILKMYMHTKYELSRSRLPKVRALQSIMSITVTHATENITTRPREIKQTSWLVISRILKDG